LFIYMGHMFAKSGIADDLYRMFHVWSGSLKGGLAIGTIGLMAAIAAMNGLSVAGMAIGATLALPEMLKRKYDKVMITGVIQAGSSLGIMIPPSVVLVLYGMIARQPVGRLWMAGLFPGLLMAVMFIIYIFIRCRLQPHLGPPLPPEELKAITWGEKLRLLRAGIVPLVIIFMMTGLFLMGITSLVECAAVGATATTIAALVNRRLSWKVMNGVNGVASFDSADSIACVRASIPVAAVRLGGNFTVIFGSTIAMFARTLEKAALTRSSG
ncbi:unnamed protein product, partial [marine sediment metagenome]